MSSSSALIVMTYLAIAALTDLAHRAAFPRHVPDPGKLATFLGAIESGASFGELVGDDGVGTRGGSQDHTAILFSQCNMLSVFGYDPVARLDAVEIPEGQAIFVATSGVKARKRRGARESYNAAAEFAARVASAWSEERGEIFPTLGHMLEDPELDESRLMVVLDEVARDLADRERLWKRFSQFHDECVHVIPGALRALRAGKMDDFGDLVDRSQEMAQHWLKNQIPETAFLARAARDAGAVAASAFGAGFGGAVWAMAPRNKESEFLRTWSASYKSAFEERAGSAHFFLDKASPGVCIAGADPDGLMIRPVPVRAEVQEPAHKAP